MQFDLVLHGGTLLHGSKTRRADVGIVGESVAAIGQDLKGKQVMEVQGMLVLPGAIDPHVHLQMPVGATMSSDDWESGTVAAACGGTTTVIDFVEPQAGETLLGALNARRTLAEGRAVVDFGLHMTLTNADPLTLNQIPGVVSAGCPTFKTYTTYEGFYLDDHAFLTVLQHVSQAGGLVLVHAENHTIIEQLRRRLLEEGKTAPRYHATARPAIAEAKAIQQAIGLAEVAGASLYIVHVSTKTGAQALRTARRKGLPILGETCPQYLLLSEEEYERPGFDGAKFVCSPPLRTAADASRLWKGLARGDLQVVATDHCPFFFHGQKDLGLGSFDHIPGGLPGVEARLALLYTFGVRQGRISLSKWIDLCCTAPARLFSLYPKKGILAPGADADIVVFDPNREVTLSTAVLHEHVDYTPYEGMKLVGYPVTTLSRGQILCSGGRFLGSRGHGRFLAR